MKNWELWFEDQLKTKKRKLALLRAMLSWAKYYTRNGNPCYLCRMLYESIPIPSKEKPAIGVFIDYLNSVGIDLPRKDKWYTYYLVWEPLNTSARINAIKKAIKKHESRTKDQKKRV